MRPDTLLTIYEIRIQDSECREKLNPDDLRKLLGPKLLGCHFESDFAFLFCEGPVNIERLLRSNPRLSLMETHLLRYDEWQDGASAAPIVMGPLRIHAPGEALVSQGSQDKDAFRPYGYVRDLPPITLDPGLAFGYGGHTTTKACLNFLLRIYSPKNQKLPQGVLDLGTGTGVLALAAARLGARDVLGVDYSHLAVDIAQINLKQNNLEDRVTFVYGEAADYASHPAELLIANIPMFVHLDLLEKGAFSKRKYLVISGVLPDEASVLIQRLESAYRVKVLDNDRDDRWSSWLLEMN